MKQIKKIMRQRNEFLTLLGGCFFKVKGFLFFFLTKLTIDVPESQGVPESPNLDLCPRIPEPSNLYPLDRVVVFLDIKFFKDYSNWH
jgi:hypothetical protein